MALSADEISRCLSELRFSDKTCDRCRELTEQEQYDALYIELRCARSRLLDEIHRAQARLDCLDCIIHEVKCKKEEK